MANDEDKFYVEIYLTGLVKVTKKDKKRKLAKLQKIINEIIEDPDLDLLKSDSNIIVMSEDELMKELKYDDSSN